MPAHAPRIDAHHHLWQYNAEEFGWISDTMAELRRDFLVADLQAALQASQVTAAVAVQARESLQETDWLLECAASTDCIAGVVGWAPLASAAVAEILDEYAGAPKLVGFREVAQGQPEGYFDRPEFDRGIRELTRRGLAYDVLIFETQLPEAIRLVDRHPQQRFVLDHAAKPKIAAGETEPWATHMRELGRRPNVCCKLSGMVTEASWTDWTPEMLQPYLDVCVSAFGTDRLLAGSDWPVCLLASSHARWWSVLREYVAQFSAAEQDRILGRNALEWYKLTL